MRVLLVAEKNFQIVAAMDGEECPTASFISEGEAATAASRKGLLAMLEHVAERGLDNLPSAWVHLANQEEKIYEFVKGSLRLFFFHGEGNQIAVCTSGILKKKQKADRPSIARAVAIKKEYFAAAKLKTIEVVDQ